MCGEMRLFLDTWAKHQTEQKLGFGALKVFRLHIGTRCSFVHVPSVSGAANRLAGNRLFNWSSLLSLLHVGCKCAFS